MRRSVWRRQGHDTSAEESDMDRPFVQTKSRRKRVPKYLRELKRLKAASNYIKIMRFRSKTLAKTFRIYCFDEKSLSWPRRFTKKVNTMVFDNDQESDKQEVEQAKTQCLDSLFEAIKLRKKQIGKKP